MRIDRVVDWDYDPYCKVMNFIDLGDNFFECGIFCDYSGDFDDWGNDKGDPNKLSLIKKRVDFNKIYFTKYNDRSSFNEERKGWLNESGHVTPFHNIKVDRLFLYVNKKLIKAIFE